ncbi:hypothetical protein ACEPAG_2116 [Sanghuangporus baumii]
MLPPLPDSPAPTSPPLRAVQEAPLAPRRGRPNRPRTKPRTRASQADTVIGARGRTAGGGDATLAAADKYRAACRACVGARVRRAHAERAQHEERQRLTRGGSGSGAPRDGATRRAAARPPPPSLSRPAAQQGQDPRHPPPSPPADRAKPPNPPRSAAARATPPRRAVARESTPPRRAPVIAGFAPISPTVAL